MNLCTLAKRASGGSVEISGFARLATVQMNTIVVIQGDSVTDWLMVAITGLGVVATLIIGILTFINNRAATSAAKKAEEAYQAANQVQLSAIQTAIDRTNAATAPPSSLVKWLILDTGKGTYALRNEGTAEAHGVHLVEMVEEGLPSTLVMAHPDPIDMAPGATLPFNLWRSIAGPAVVIIEVRWVDDDGNERSERRLVN